MAESKQPGLGQLAFSHIAATFDSYLGRPEEIDGAIRAASEHLPASIVEKVSAVLKIRAISYRFGLVIQLAAGLVTKIDHTKRSEGGRSTSQLLGEYCSPRHISAPPDAYSNIAKNTD